MRQIAPALIKSIQTVVTRTGGSWVVSRFAASAATETAARQAGSRLGSRMFGIVFQVILFAFEPAEACAPEPPTCQTIEMTPDEIQGLFDILGEDNPYLQDK